jgi:steroid delta-isomerase-like uncharacterized protein
VSVNAANVALARRWFDEVWNQKRTQTVHELVRPDSVCYADHGEMRGPEPFLQFHAELLRAVPDLEVTVEDVVSQGDTVVVRWSAAGTHTGPFRDGPATGRAVRFRGLTWIRCGDGCFVEGWDAWNVGGVVGQLMGQ